MSVPLNEAVQSIQAAAADLFAAGPTIRSLGVAQAGDGFGYVAVRNATKIVASAANLPSTYRGISVQYQNSMADPTALLRVPSSGYGSPGSGSLVPEQQRQRPLACGLQVQNYDADDRRGAFQQGYITIGTLGCFVQQAGGVDCALWNNHVLAGENLGQRGSDRILQAGASAFDPDLHICVLQDFEPLVVSPPGASMVAGTVLFNEIDAAIATLVQNKQHQQAYLPVRPALPPRGTAVAGIGDKVHKVGRTTGLSFGVVTQVSAIAQVSYHAGECWFRDSLVIEGLNGAGFSDRGDSGSAIVRDSDGMVVGLLYAGNGTQTYACPIGPVLQRFGCALA